MGALTIQADGKRLDLIRKTVAKDCNPAEFDWFLHICQRTRLDPLRRQIYAFVFHAKDPKRRQMVPVTAIAGLRAIAARTGNYRPDSQPPRLDLCEPDAAINPQGILRAEVTVYAHAHGEWFPVVGEAYWEEFAPIVERWGENEDGERVPTGKRYLDPKKEGWTRMPRLMLAKCAEALALRKAWPEDCGDLYEEAEVDRARSIDLTPSEMAETAAQEDRFDRIGGRATITIDWLDGAALERVPAGQFADRAIDHIRKLSATPLAVVAWQERNRHAINEYWAIDKAGALEIKKVIEPIMAAAPKTGIEAAVVAAKVSMPVPPDPDPPPVAKAMAKPDPDPEPDDRDIIIHDFKAALAKVHNTTRIAAVHKSFADQIDALDEPRREVARDLYKQALDRAKARAVA